MATIKSAPTPISQGNIGGLFLIIFGVVVAICALVILRITGLETVSEDTLRRFDWWLELAPKTKLSRWVWLVIAIDFLLAAVLMIRTGWQEELQKSLTKSFKKQYLESPWIWDFPWKNGRNLQRKKTSFLGHLFGLTCILTFHAVAWSLAASKGFSGSILIFPIGISLFTLLVLAITIMNYRRNRVHKEIKISLDKFPVKCGANFKVHISSINPKVREISANLQAIEEVYNHGYKSKALGCNVVYEQEQLVEVNSSIGTVSFEIPDQAITTNLSARPAKFWELHLYAHCEGADLDKRFFIPIY